MIAVIEKSGLFFVVGTEYLNIVKRTSDSKGYVSVHISNTHNFTWPQ